MGRLEHGRWHLPLRLAFWHAPAPHALLRRVLPPHTSLATPTPIAPPHTLHPAPRRLHCATATRTFHAALLRVLRARACAHTFAHPFLRLPHTHVAARLFTVVAPHFVTHFVRFCVLRLPVTTVTTPFPPHGFWFCTHTPTFPTRRRAYPRVAVNILHIRRHKNCCRAARRHLIGMAAR